MSEKDEWWEELSVLPGMQEVVDDFKLRDDLVDPPLLTMCTMSPGGSFQEWPTESSQKLPGAVGKRKIESLTQVGNNKKIMKKNVSLSVDAAQKIHSSGDIKKSWIEVVDAYIAWFNLWCSKKEEVLNTKKDAGGVATLGFDEVTRVKVSLSHVASYMENIQQKKGIVLPLVLMSNSKKLYISRKVYANLIRQYQMAKRKECCFFRKYTSESIMVHELADPVRTLLGDNKLSARLSPNSIVCPSVG